jgi:hypothetical protein
MSHDLVPRAPNPYQPPTSLPEPEDRADAQEQETVELERQPNSREEDAARALKSAIFGLLFCPLQIYTAWLLLLVLANEEPLRARYFWYAVGAAAVLAPYSAIVGVFGWLSYGS